MKITNILFVAPNLLWSRDGKPWVSFIETARLPNLHNHYFFAWYI